MKKKLLIFTFSSLVSLVLLEIGIRTTKYIILADRKSSFSKEVNTSSRDYKDSIKIAAMGDSFTFGGGVQSWETYPHLLQKKLDKKFPKMNIVVTNNGLCEATSRDILENLEPAIKLTAPDVILLLVGGANTFDLLRDTARDESSFLEDLDKIQVFKMLRWVSIELTSRFGFDQKYEIKSSGDRSKHVARLEAIISDIINPKMDGREPIYDEEQFSQLMRSFKLQSTYDAKKVALIFKDAMDSESNRKKYTNLKKIHAAFNNLVAWDKKMLDYLKEDLSKIYEIATRNNIFLVLQLYPVEYKAVNEVISSFASEKKLLLVNHGKTFNEKIQKELGGKRKKLIFNDDHATIEGHKLMAENVFEKLGPFLEKNVEKLKANGRDTQYLSRDEY